MRTVFETTKYKRTILYETNKTRIMFAECKQDRRYDRINFVKMHDDVGEDAEIIGIYRWEDEQFINDILKRYGAE